ncbi:MAG: glycerate kinase [Planctomycetaceae bacterium]|nr:MAG: glycerate kinase [Planctomycetaceae bacterium]
MMSALPSRDCARDAWMIWHEAVRSVAADRLIAQVVRCDSKSLEICGERFRLIPQRRVFVVGGGKACGAMAEGLERCLSEVWLQRTTGLVNVPENCVKSLQRIELHAGRPAGVNEPTEEGYRGVQHMLSLLRQMTPDDLCIVLLSGGGSALLPAPLPGLTLAVKQRITRCLMQRGATIQELNTVRACLSQIKRGGLLRAIPAGTCITLAISDVVGDDPEVIASGPTIPVPPQPQRALEIVKQYCAGEPDIFDSVVHLLQTQLTELLLPPVVIPHFYHIVGNNRMAVEAAARHASAQGYQLAWVETDREGEVAAEGRRLWQAMSELTRRECPGRGWCWISGGEPVVDLKGADADSRGGRNQELALAALDESLRTEVSRAFCFLSGGTDGEDGPTDAAGARFDHRIRAHVLQHALSVADYLRRHDSYSFWQRLGTLIHTGPTHTNVMDLRVGLITSRLAE